MYKKGAGNEKQGKDAGNRTLCPYGNFSQAIMGCTQLPYAARLVARMDQGHGLLDRMNITIPNCLRPSPDDTLIAIDKCKQYSSTSIGDSLHELHCTKLPPLFQR